MEANNKNRGIIILRWIMFLPCAAIAALLGWYVANFLGRIGLYFVQFDSKSFISQLYFNTIGHAAMAIAFVYVGFKIAPSHSKTIAYVLSGIWLLFNGFTLFTGIMMKSGWAIWGSIWSFVVIVVLALFIYRNEIEI